MLNRGRTLTVERRAGSLILKRLARSSTMFSQLPSNTFLGLPWVWRRPPRLGTDLAAHL
jgi:hypothetical protein